MRRSAARRVSNHEGTQVDRAPPILRSGRHSHDVKQRDLLPSRACVSSFPRRVYAPGFVFILSRPSPRGAGGAPTGAVVLLSRLRGATSALVRRGASHDAGRSPLGAPPWRFSAGGRASISGIASGSVQRAPRSQVVMPGGRCPGPPEPAVTSRSRRTPLPAPPSGSSLEDAPHERGWESIAQLRYVVNRKVRM